MSDFNPLLLLLLIQMTIPLLVLRCIYRWLQPELGQQLILALAGFLFALLVYHALPEIDVAIAQKSEKNSTEMNHSPEFVSQGDAAKTTPSGIDVLAWIRQLPTEDRENSSTVNWVYLWKGFCYLLLGWTLVACGRFFFRYWLLLQWKQTLMPICNQDFLQVAERLARQIGIQKPVHYCQSSEVAVAVLLPGTPGVIVLHTDWPTWSNSELQVALAHELAHCKRGDARQRLYVHFLQALFPFHPLLRWLVQQLEFVQEVLSDRLAAKTLGNSDRYLQGLAQLLLRYDAKSTGFCPAIASTSSPLIRRIGMFHVQDDSRNRLRYTAWAVMIVSAITTLFLHANATPILAEPTKELPPLDWKLAAFHTGNTEGGFYCWRVQQFANDPMLQKLIQLEEKMLQSVGMHNLFASTEIEQIAGRVYFSSRPDLPSPNRSLGMSLTGIRLSKAIDWKKQVEMWFGDVETRQHDGKTFWVVTEKSKGLMTKVIPLPIEGLALHALDEKTCVIRDVKLMEMLLTAMKKPITEPDWLPSWKAMESTGLAVLFGEPKKQFQPAFDLPKDAPPLERILTTMTQGILRDSARVTFSASITQDAFQNQLQLQFQTAEQAKTATEGIQSLISLMAKSLPPEMADRALLQSAKVTQEKETMSLKWDEKRIYSMLKEGVERMISEVPPMHSSKKE